MSNNQQAIALEQMAAGYLNVCTNGPSSAVEMYADAMKQTIENARPSDRTSESETDDCNS